MIKVLRLIIKGGRVLISLGPVEFTKRLGKFLYFRFRPEARKNKMKDILIVNGCALPHPERYRVNHQAEQLESHGLSVDMVFYEKLDIEMLRFYRGFIFFRCPITSTVKKFILEAKKFNKTCFYDIDDLVIDTKYTDRIDYVQKMNAEDKRIYDDGVRRMGETLLMCDHAITTTSGLKKELQKYVKNVFINRNVASDEMIYHSNMAVESKNRKKDRIVIGYFSGSITHNEDFAIVIPALVRLMSEFENLYVKVVGIIDLPAELMIFRDRFISTPFVDWRKLPEEIAECDINIAPLTKSIFNNAKSENKWTEAALVKVPTVATGLGAFAEVIDDMDTGVLVRSDNWYKALRNLIVNKELREQIGSNARRVVLEKHTTINTGSGIAEFIKKHLSKSIAFVIPTSDISGGVNVVVKHAEVMRDKGWDVTLIDDVSKGAYKQSKKKYQYRETLPGLNMMASFKTDVLASFDVMVATLWTTVKYVKKYPFAKTKKYIVQSYETGFYPPGAGLSRLESNATYCDETGISYVTISLWCQRWLKEVYGKSARYCSNGIDPRYYNYKKRDFNKKQINILIEGDSQSEYKNTDEAFRIVNLLDPDKYKISYLSYRKEPKVWYRVDHFYNRIPPEEVGEVYASCDILIKTSLLESFSYPPLEMMATGGVAVVLPNEGNREYLVDGYNCLFYKAGDVVEGAAKVERIVSDSELRARLISNGLKTAKKYAWSNLENDIAALYES